MIEARPCFPRISECRELFRTGFSVASMILIFLTLLTKDRYHPTGGYELVIGGLQLGTKVVEFRFEELYCRFFSSITSTAPEAKLMRRCV